MTILEWDAAAAAASCWHFANSRWSVSWWCHQMETYSAVLAICAGNSPVTGEFPTRRPVTRSFDVFFDLRLNKRLNKQWWGWWFETPSRPLWRHCNEHLLCFGHLAGLLAHLEQRMTQRISLCVKNILVMINMSCIKCQHTWEFKVWCYQ